MQHVMVNRENMYKMQYNVCLQMQLVKHVLTNAVRDGRIRRKTGDPEIHSFIYIKTEPICVEYDKDITYVMTCDKYRTYLTLRIRDKTFCRWQFEIFFLFSAEIVCQFIKIVSFRNMLQEMTNPIFREK